MAALLNERYALWLNSEGQPVEKSLAEMTVGEVLRALDYAEDEHRRLEALCEPDRPLYDLAKRGEAAPPDIDPETLLAAAQRARAAAAASNKAADLLQQIHAAIPQWRRYPKLPLTAAVRRFWPR